MRAVRHLLCVGCTPANVRRHKMIDNNNSANQKRYSRAYHRVVLIMCIIARAGPMKFSLTMSLKTLLRSVAITIHVVLGGFKLTSLIFVE